MGGSLDGKRIAFLVANSGVEQVELTTPWAAVQDAGGTPLLIAPEKDDVQAMHGSADKADTFTPDDSLDAVSAADFDGLVLPGGVANPDKLRIIPAAVDFVKSFALTGKPVAAICHAPWTLVEAGVLVGKTLTSWPSLGTDIRNAGGTWVDKEVEVSAANGWTLVTSRKPDDLDAFVHAFTEVFASTGN
jgi:protease I